MTKYEQVRQFLIGEKIKQLKAEQKVMEVRLFVEEAKRKQTEYELRYNHNHDPKNGQFCSGSGAGNIDKPVSKAYNDSDSKAIKITEKVISAVPKPDIFADDDCNAVVQALCREVLKDVKDDPLNTERANSVSLSDIQTGRIKNNKSKGGDGEGAVNIKVLDEPYLSIHNHPSGETFSAKDVREFMLERNEQIMIVIGNNGNVYTMEKKHNSDTTSALPKVIAYKNGILKADSDAEFWKGLYEYGIEYKEFSRSGDD